ncbi:glycosyltransferase family 2 protein [Pseudoalteromonas sp. 2CM36K]|uniref:glycosyltransferase family 2 protein n=1 Tax=Pseudoalteromonas sp. 2CM36K TaxID=2929854 RepID=UPI0020BFF832|nr:glycosyltransferase family A protein [Pseudoalteromonas sp. 2CM36K]MCK8104709.1 glycosyltransferase family 2 protein [Pseudoalteromonas sp. 2CM36K]
MGNIKISVVVPVYNAGMLIERCCDSILEQTVADVELILINDGSTDDSLSICKKIQHNDPRVKLITIENSGPAKARNIGIKAAKGEYIAFVDADDYIEENCYEVMSNYIDEKQTVDVVISSINMIKGASTSRITNPLIPVNTVLNQAGIINYILSRYYNGGLECIPSLCNKLYKRSFLMTHNLLIDEKRVRAEDYWFNFSVFKLAKKVIYTKTITYNYVNESSDSIMHSYRANDVDNFILTRTTLLREMSNIDVAFENDVLWSSLFYELNEHVFKMLSAKCTYNDFNVVITKPKLKEYLNKCKKLPFHQKLLLIFININMNKVVFYIYKAWYMLAKKGYIKR